MSLYRFFFPDLRERLYQEELMDRDDCSEVKLRRTIRQFTLLNVLFSATMRLFKKHLLPRMLGDKEKTWTILDFGAGGADIDRRIVRLCRRNGIQVRITALDYDARIVPWAQEACRDYPEIEVVHGSIFDLSTDYDFIVSNHTLHHFTYPQVRRTVELCLAHAREGLLLNDLHRSNWGFLGYTIFTGLFVHRSLAFIDGRLSVRRGFTVDELWESLDGIEGIETLSIRTTKPSRVYLLRLEA